MIPTTPSESLPPAEAPSLDTPALPPPPTPEMIAAQELEKEKAREEEKLTAQVVSIIRQAANACARKEFTKARTFLEEANSLLGIDLPAGADEDESLETAMARKKGTQDYVKQSRSALSSSPLPAMSGDLPPVEEVAALPKGESRYDSLT